MFRAPTRLYARPLVFAPGMTLARDDVEATLQRLGYEADTVLPTAVVTDASGRILLSDQTDNYRVRPEPETFLAILDAAG